MTRTSMNKNSSTSPKTSVKALEAAAINRLTEMNKGQKVQPSKEAVMIAARMIAMKAHRQS